MHWGRRLFESMLCRKRMVGWLYWGLTPLEQLRSYHSGRWCTRVSWLSHTSTNTTFFPKPPTTILTCFSRGEKRKYRRKKFRLNRVSNSQPLCHESDMLTTEPPRWGCGEKEKTLVTIINFLQSCFQPVQKQILLFEFQYNYSLWLPWILTSLKICLVKG